MPQVSLEWLGEKMTELIAEVRAVRLELSAMRSEIDGAFHMMRGTGGHVEGLRRFVDGQGQCISALERKIDK